jgi:2Fe-2S ferredoxin
VILREGSQSCNEPTDDELDMLDQAPGLEPESRLGCQAVPDGSCDVVIEIPDWNRNLVKEDH